MQELLFQHFYSEGQEEFLKDKSVTCIDKTDASDPKKREMLKTVFEQLWFFIIQSLILDWVLLAQDYEFLEHDIWHLFVSVWCEECSKFGQVCRAIGLVEIVNGLKPLTVVTKTPALHIWLSSEIAPYELYRRGIWTSHICRNWIVVCYL